MKRILRKKNQPGYLLFSILFIPVFLDFCFSSACSSLRRMNHAHGHE